jgi:hypothetical protein
MSLNWNLSNIPDHMTTCYETFTGTPDEMEALVERVLFMGPNWSYTADKTAVQRMSVTTHTLLFALMDVGIGALTPSNVEEAFLRLHMTETACGAFRQTIDNGPVFFTREEVQMHTGLTTNINEKTKAQFHAHLTKSWRASLARKAVTA